MTAPTMPKPGTRTRPKLPQGVKWSPVWKINGQFVEAEPGAQELPVDPQWRIVGEYWACPVEECDVDDWTFDRESDAEVPCCPRHPVRLVAVALDGSSSNPAETARNALTEHLRAVYARRKKAAQDAVQARLDAAHKAIADATRATTADMRGHIPSIAASVCVLSAGTVLAVNNPPLAALIGAGLATCGPVVAYLVTYLLRRWRTGDRVNTKQARNDRQVARHIAAGTFAAGLWAASSAAASVLPLTGQIMFTLCLGAVLMFAVNHAHWQQLWDARHRIKDMLRRKAEAEALRAEQEAARVAQQPASTFAPVTVDENDPAVMGARMAAEWLRVSQLPSVQTGFPQMPRTSIAVDDTRPIDVPDDDGNLIRIGWEYTGHAEPGALVARLGAASPVVAARDWLVAVLFDGRHDPANVSIVDRPGGQANRFIITISDRFQLGSPVTYKGAAGIRRGPDGALYGHIGRTLLGDDAERVLWVPGQAGGGGRYGVTGSGKSVVTQTSLLNDLYAGIFPLLWDGKNLMDFAEFIGVIPMGCTTEHRDVMYQSVRAEMVRRQRMLMTMEGKDRHGRPAPVEALWVPGRDGPPQRWTIEEFHLNARDEAFINNTTELVRLQRSSATMLEIATQGGGLADAGNSVLRDNLNNIAMQIMRMGDQQARLTGYSGDYMPSRLPRLPGMMLLVEADAPAVPVRAAFVHRRDEDGNIYDHLYDQNNNPILTAPALPAETLKVYEREGLMDLWRMGQGPGGKNRLLSSIPVSPSGVQISKLGPFAGQPLQAPDVLLGIVFTQPAGCAREQVDGHSAWLKPQGGGKNPAPSTVSRAVGKLEKEGKLVRADGVYTLTEKGRPFGHSAAVALGLVNEAAREEAAERAGEDAEPVAGSAGEMP